MDITFGKNNVHEAELLDKMMEMREDLMIWKIKRSRATNIVKKEYCDIEIDSK